MAQDALRGSKMTFQKEEEVAQEKSYEERIQGFRKKDGTLDERAEGYGSQVINDFNRT